jgi:hypothetical protein
MRHSESGNALFMLFVVVILFGMLAFAFLQGSRTSTGMLTDEQATVEAQSILDTGNALKGAVQRLSKRDCKDTEISFENNDVAGYTNASTPGDYCKVFHSKGGSLKFPVAMGNDGTNWIYKGSEVVPSLKSGSSELIAYLYNVKDPVCQKINQKLHFANGTVLTEEQTAGSLFTGTYSVANTFECSYGAVGNCNGVQAGCVNLQAGYTNMFYQVLLPR